MLLALVKSVAFLTVKSVNVLILTLGKLFRLIEHLLLIIICINKRTKIHTCGDLK